MSSRSTPLRIVTETGNSASWQLRSVGAADDQAVALEAGEDAVLDVGRGLAIDQRGDDAAARKAVAVLEALGAATARRDRAASAAVVHRAVVAARRARAAYGGAELHHRLVEGRGLPHRDQPPHAFVELTRVARPAVEPLEYAAHV